MAQFSFLDLMFAEALASGLARKAIRAERPPPDNFFLLPKDPGAWKMIKEASKKENMVVCVEITDGMNENCKRVRSIFLDMAREFDGIPFVRVNIEPGATYIELRKDLGGVQFTPTILVVFFGDDSVSRAKFEGEAEIRRGIATGQIEGVIKELVSRRVKLKMAERMAEGLAESMKHHLSDRERKIREEYETRLQKQMAEKEEEFRKKEEEKRKKEEEENKKDQKRRQTLERIRLERPQHVEELLKMDLDSASIRDIKSIMVKMGVSTHDCFERADLKQKLMDNVPELRINTISSSRNSSMSEDSGCEALNHSETNTREKELKKDLEQSKHDLDKMTTRANKAEDSVLSLQSQVKSLQRKISSLEDDARIVQNTSTESMKVNELETSLLETRMLYTTNIQDYEIVGLIHDDEASGSLVVKAKCIKPSIPHKERLYAMKVLTNYFKEQTQTQVRQDFQNEYQVLCQMPPHENIIHMWAFFYDRLDPRASKYFKKAGSSNMHSMSLFILMEEHLINMTKQLKILVETTGPQSDKVLSWFKDLLSALRFLEQQCVIHRDLKLDNLLLSSKGRLIVSDFGKAIHIDETFKMNHLNGLDIGGNRAHLAPEILNSKPGPRNYLDYSKQSVWAAGVLAYELAGHPSPFKAGTIDQRGYGVDELPPLKFTFCKSSNYCQRLPSELTRLVVSMLQPDMDDRFSLQRCVDSLL